MSITNNKLSEKENSLYKLTETALNTLSKEDAILALFAFIHAQIPADTIACFHINRTKMSLTSSISYTAEEVLSGHSFQLKKIFPKELVSKHYGENFEKFFIVHDIKQEDENYQTTMKYFPYTFGSVLSFCIYFTAQKDFYTIVALFSHKENVFQDSDMELCELLKPLLKKYLLPVYLREPGRHLVINPNLALYSTHHEQIRACPSMQKTLHKIMCVAQYGVNVLIQGATGTGKELVAESIHAYSPRSQKAFIRVNCAAIPENLLEGELFGYEKGAFTGALQSRRGYFEQANNGTIFLDEIGELSLNAQIRLLRVLENREVQRIGSEKVTKLDIHIIAATHKNLEEMVNNKEFREDLFYRLNVFPIYIQPLAKRREDIPVLIEYFYTLYVNKFQLKKPPQLCATSLVELINYSWPGNVRQLRHAIERAIIDALSNDNKLLDFSFLPKHTMLVSQNDAKQSMTKEYLEEVLQKTNGKIQGKNGAAHLLDLHPATLRSRLKALGIPFGKAKQAQIPLTYHPFEA